ncbi:FxsA family protein [Pararhizobium mangrovi]|uniref:Membrane protein FxsA n=1 Tax=Pararhizobium mangrovi TaxID=2590452 RepID=A0A506U3Y6_9HYPH|nr:FxsA family protein [Pararhizobium mangrovi]TPW27259.1 membrane protein FxsA [Pararhizobium mangrovi]
MAFSLIPFMLLALPIAEIAVFILVGQYIGLLPTVGIILLTAVLGSILLRVQGFGLLARIREESEKGRVPGRELVHGVMILVAGVLLLTPGFITDTLGFLLFVPPIRDAAWKLLRERIVIMSASGFRRPGRMDPDAGAHGRPGGPRGRRGEPVIDLGSDEFESKPDPSSPWNSRDDRA